MTTRTYGSLGFESSNEDKVLFPEIGLTKGELIDYHERIAEHTLPHLEARPLVMHRFPDGIDDDGFYQKQVGDYFPDWIDTVEVALRGQDARQTLVVASNAATLAYLGNQAAITLHPWLSRGRSASDLDAPDMLVVDLDPPSSGDDYEEAFELVRTAAEQVRGLFDDLELTAFAKLTGSKGVHVVVPLDRSADFDATRSFARAAMDLLADRHPDTLTTAHRKNKRKGRLYLDVARNAYGQTAVAPYSVRALPTAPVATPVRWDELRRGDLGPRDFTVQNIFRRLGQIDDPWADMRQHAVGIDAARARLERLRETEDV